MATRRSGPVCVFGLLLLLSIGMPVAPSHAQQAGAIPEIENAELLFEEGVAAFERGEYETAHERFRLVSEYALNRKTTAALLMDGKALVQLGRYRDAIGRLEALLNQYAETTYRDEAARLLERARRRLQEETQAQDTLRVGVTLPMGAAEVSLSQALFNGIRLAVDEHNGLRRRYIRPPGLRTEADTFEVYDTARLAGDSLAAADGETTVAAPADTVRVDSLRVVAEQVERPDWVAKMYFRRTGPRPKAARAAVDSLVRLDDVDVILGPIRSRVARPAGERAEAARVPLVAPMATDESVSEGKNYVFQANPTIPDRGRIMARTAKNGLLINRVGIVYEEGNGLSARMAEGFREEARRQGLTVPLSIPLQGGRDWSRLPTLLTDSTLIETGSRRARRDSATIDSLPGPAGLRHHRLPAGRDGGALPPRVGPGHGGEDSGRPHRPSPNSPRETGARQRRVARPSLQGGGQYGRCHVHERLLRTDGPAGRAAVRPPVPPAHGQPPGRTRHQWPSPGVRGLRRRPLFANHPLAVGHRAHPPGAPHRPDVRRDWHAHRLPGKKCKPGAVHPPVPRPTDGASPLGTRIQRGGAIHPGLKPRRGTDPPPCRFGSALSPRPQMPNRKQGRSSRRLPSS